MNDKNVADLIKKIRKDNNLTQNELANKLGVTYQAVSKWENGKNIPDIMMLKKISSLYNIDIDDFLDGNYKKKKNYIYIALLVFIILFALILVLFRKDSDISLKPIESSCDNFTITGYIAYNDSKSSISISDVKYCGGDDNNVYSSVSCALYEEEGSTIQKITDCDTKYNIKLNDYLNDMYLVVDNYKNKCKAYKNNSIYLKIEAVLSDEKTINYKIPLKLGNSCL